MPNKTQVIDKSHKWSFAKQDVYKLQLLDDYKATAKFCKDGKKCEQTEIKGKWTPVYAQSLVVELDNGLRFVTNFRYNHAKAKGLSAA